MRFFAVLLVLDTFVKNLIVPGNHDSFETIKDGGGTISTDEFKTLLDTLGVNTDPQEMDNIIMEIDSDNSGEIEFNEFAAVMSRRVNPSYTSSQIKNAFKVFETSETSPGFVKVETLFEALTTYGEKKLSAKEARDLLSQLDHNRSGVVKYQEFVDIMMN